MHSHTHAHMHTHTHTHTHTHSHMHTYTHTHLNHDLDELLMALPTVLHGLHAGMGRGREIGHEEAMLVDDHFRTEAAQRRSCGTTVEPL